MRILRTTEIISLLRSEIKRAGGISAWSRRTGIERTTVSRVANKAKLPTRRIIKALKLRIVVVADDLPIQSD